MPRNISWNHMKKSWKIALIILASFLGIWMLILIALNIILSPKILTSIVNKYANEYIDANVSFKEVNLSMFRDFPNLSLRLDSCMITYPSERYAAYMENPDLLKMSRLGSASIDRSDSILVSISSDTLAVFNKLDASVNPFALLTWKLRIPLIELEKPRIFAHTFDEQHSNWDIFGESDEESEESSDFSLPRISLGRISMTKLAHIVYTSNPDTVSAIIRTREISFKGIMDKDFSINKKINLRTDSLFVLGRVTSDTLIANVDHFNINGDRNNQFDFQLRSKAYWGSGSYGRLAIPINLDGEFSLRKDSLFTIEIPDIHGDIAHIPLKLSDGLVKTPDDSLYLKANLTAENISIYELLQNYGKQIVMDEADKVQTDALANVYAELDGHYIYETGRFPSLKLTIDIPQSSVGYEGIEHKAKFKLNGEITTDKDYKYNLDLKKIDLVAFDSTFVKVNLKMLDILADDPLFKIHANLKSSLDSISSILPPQMGIRAKGNLSGTLTTDMLLSQMDMIHFCQANTKGVFTASRLKITDKVDSLDLYVDTLNIILGSLGNKRNEDMKVGERVLAIAAKLDSTSAQYCDIMRFGLKDVKLFAQNSAAIISEGDSNKFYPFFGSLNAGLVYMTDTDSTVVVVKNTKNKFRISPKKGNRLIPILKLNSSNEALFLKAQSGRVGIKNLDLNATAAMNTIEKKARIKNILDSLSLVYPDTPRDSLFKKAYQNRPKKNVPSWMNDKEFEKGNIDFKLDESLAKYFREWDINADASLNSLRLFTPLFPIKTSASNAKLSFNNNQLKLSSISFDLGNSNLEMVGEINGLRRALLWKGAVDLDLKILANSMDFNELMAAYSTGYQYLTSNSQNNDSYELSDEEYAQMIDKQMSDEPTSESSTLIVPGNVNANIKLEGYNISYSNMTIDWLNSDIVMKDRCVQIGNTIAAANLGDLFFEGFYATKTKDDISAGFNLSLMDITAGEVVQMIPQIDTLVPMIKSFSGLLDCEIAGTTMIDTSMNLIMPSVNGIMRISGKDLTIAHDDDLRKITKILKFKNRDEFSINNMSVEGIIKDNKLEIFPFLLEIEDYNVAMSGIQNMDMSFKYHVSVIKSPLVFKFGVDLYGADFDHMKFKLGKAKYKNARTIPAFSSTIDQTKLNLSESIRKIFERGVEQAILENQKQAAISAKKEELSYDVNEKMEELSDEEKSEIENIKDLSQEKEKNDN